MNPDASKSKFTTVSIPTPLFVKIEQRIKDSDFTSVSSYVAYVLQEILADEEDTSAFSEEDEEKVKDRLRSLGYLE